MPRATPRIASLAVGLLFAGAAAGQDSGPRFSLSPTPDGFLKLDGKSGVVSECKREAAGYQCRLVPDEREALQSEVDRLSRENQQLHERLASGDTPQAVPDARRPSMPADEEVDRALGLMEKFVKRFMAIIREDAPKPDKQI